MLSIIIPTYNRASFLPRVVKSIKNQTYKNWELIIVDDGSTDETQEVVKTFIRKDKRIKYSKLPQNRGIFAAYNQGILAANGDWVCFLDSDDEYLPGALKTISSTLKKTPSQISVVQFTALLKDKDGRIEQLGYQPPKKWQQYLPTYEDIVLKKHIKQDMHRCIRLKIARANPFPENKFCLNSAYYANLAKRNVKFIYINKNVVQINTDAPDQHSKTRVQIWPTQLAKGYAEFVCEHEKVLKKGGLYFDKSILIAKLYGRACRPAALTLFAKAFLSNPTKFTSVFLRLSTRRRK